MKPYGIEPATFGLAAQCLNHLRRRVPQYDMEIMQMYRLNTTIKLLFPVLNNLLPK